MVSALFDQHAATHILIVGILTAGLQFHQCEWDGWTASVMCTIFLFFFSWVPFSLPPAYYIQVIREREKKESRSFRFPPPPLSPDGSASCMNDLGNKRS